MSPIVSALRSRRAPGICAPEARCRKKQKSPAVRPGSFFTTDAFRLRVPA